MAAIRTSAAGYPMAPSQSEWDALTPEERAEVYKELPGEVTDAEIAMPEGDRHFKAKTRPVASLRGYFERQGRRIYIANELPNYYPAEPRFAPDLLVVFDVEDHDRDKWVVSAEAKGLDWVLEVHVGGDRKKDAELNVERYARLGIPEYFLYDAGREQLSAYRLPTPEARVYDRIEAERGRYPSRVLGLDVQIENGRLRFLSGTAVLLESEELITRLESLLRESETRAQDEARRARALEAEVERLRTELARLKP